MNNILVIAPHADDEVIGCGATIAKHVHQGDQVWVTIATNASKGAPELFKKEDIDKIRKEALEAHKVLGVQETIFMDFPAPALNAYPEYKISLEISKLLDKIRPDTLYLPHPGDIHQDHKAIYRASLVACRPKLDFSISNIFCYETLSETEWTPIHEKPFVPNYFVNISSYFNDKVKAMECYGSQMKLFPHSRSIEAFEALAKYRGATVAVSRAEAFTVERLIK